MARPQVPDTTVFVQGMRHAWLSLTEWVLRGDIWLSAVVVCELYAGTRSDRERRQLRRMVAGSRRENHLLVPSADDWMQAGTLLARRARLYGAIRHSDHLADVLILLSAARIGGEIRTANVRHFEAWADLARRAGLDVVVTASGSP